MATTRTIHPAAQMFPMIEGAAYEQFRNDIERQGLLQPIAVLPDGSVLDGRNRLRACEELDIEPRFVTVNPESPLAYVLSANKHRRHLTSSQLAMLAADEVPKLRPAAEERMRAGGKVGGETAGKGRPKADSPVEKSLQGYRHGTRRSPTVDKAAELFGTNGNYVQAALTLKANAPDLAEKVMAGTLNIEKARGELAKRTGRRAQTLANAAVRNANEWLGRIQGVPGYCEGVSAEAVRGDASLLRSWQEALRDAIASMRALQKKLEV